MTRLELVLVRHGETEWTDRGLLHGRLDSPLSLTGRRHAELTARQLHGERFDALYTSPRGRALQTASILGAAVGRTPQPLDGLQEADYGWMEGRPIRLFEPDGTVPRLLRLVVRLSIGLTGERHGKFSRRVGAAVEQLIERHPRARLLVVTHWGVLSITVALLVDRDTKVWRRYGPWAACGIAELRAAEDSWRVVRMNERSHLHDKKQL